MAQHVEQNEQRRQLRELLVERSRGRVPGVVAMLGPPLPWAALGHLAAQQSNTRRQLQSLHRVTKPESDPVLTVVLLAQVSSAVGEAAQAEEILRRALAHRPKEIVLWDILGKLLRSQGRRRLQEAIACYQAIRVRDSRLGVALVNALNEAGRGQEAESVSRDLLRQQPNHPEMWFHLGYSLAAQQKLAEAAAAWKEAIRRKPDIPQAHNNLGNALREQGKLAEAVAAYKEAIRLKPDHSGAYNNLGNALADQGKLAEAVAAHKEAIRLKPDDPTYPFASTWVAQPDNR